MPSSLSSLSTAALTLLLAGCSDRSSEGPAGGAAAVETGSAPGSAAGDSPAAPAPRVRAEVSEVDFQTVLKGELRVAEFPFENTGNAPLVVQMIQVVCGCTVARVVAPDGSAIVPPTNKPPDPRGIVTLLPGERSVLVVELATEGQKTGSLAKHVAIHTNDPYNAVLRLNLRAVIEAPFVLDPHELSFGEVRRGETPSLTLNVVAAALQGAEVTGLSVVPEWLDASVRRTEGVGHYAIEVRVRDDAPVGYLKGTLRARVDHPTFDGFDVSVFATVKSRLRFDTGNPANRERIDFEVLRPGTPKTAHVEVSIEEGLEPFLVTGVRVDASHADMIRTDVVTLEPGKRYRVDVVCTADPSLRFLRGTLHIETNHVDQPVKDLPFQGWVDSNP